MAHSLDKQDRIMGINETKFIWRLEITTWRERGQDDDSRGVGGKGREEDRG